nr:MAG TPA: hypothetical protein [Caudoviricetes sp.]
MADTKTTEPVDKFTKQQLAESKRFKKKRDLLEALLEDDKEYTIAEADGLIDGYLRKKVK